ncbi:hypothetical protein [Streptomyces syringium]|uniref:hypothetical protein n=1 Tax=Streptomyces syringium TaxID=76729 RepID=UPI003AAC0A73
MNAEWALNEFDKLIEQTVMRNASGGGVIAASNVTATPDVEVTKQAHVSEKMRARWVDAATVERAEGEL